MHIKPTRSLMMNKLFWYFFSLFMWIGGIVIANGFWSTLFAIFIPLWAWYLVIEKMFMSMGWV